MPAIQDITGQRCGRLTAIQFTKVRRSNGNRSTYWLWRCDCESEGELKTRHVKYGEVLSCGCLSRERKVRAHRTMLVREGVIRFKPPFGETVVIDAVRLRELNGEVDWKWRAIGLIPPRPGIE